MPAQDSEDRREYYRIDNQIALQIRLLASGNVEHALLLQPLQGLQLTEYVPQLRLS